MSLMITQQSGEFCGGSVSPDTNMPPVPLFRLCSAADRQYQVPNTHVSTEGDAAMLHAHSRIDVHAGAHSTYRDVINMQSEAYVEDSVCWHHYAEYIKRSLCLSALHLPAKGRRG